MEPKNDIPYQVCLVSVAWSLMERRIVALFSLRVLNWMEIRAHADLDFHKYQQQQ